MCSQKDLPKKYKCMENKELYSYFQKVTIRFLEPITYIDYEDLDDPIKSTIKAS